MENVIIMGILLMILLGAIVTLVRRAGRRGCCGSSGDYKPRKKKLKNVIATKVFVVDGMHCEKCAGRVTEAVNDIPGVAGVVDLKKGLVTVSYERDVPDGQLRAAIEQVGYSLREVR